ncbi:hypothetical protein, partial [Burkholderia multivorans]|uniref:hypothetical protein n=1 Tax=Burkholderia multivorans TaxID=87883 RepID=UPI0028706040
AKICCSCSWLHFLKSWSLLKTRGDSNILKAIGYNKERIMRGGKQVRGWVRTDAASAGDDRPI